MSDVAALPAAPAGGFSAISKYNPHLWSAEQLRAIFVARKNELNDLLRTLQSTPPDTVGQHVLLVGARGMGKSTLMQRLALAVEDDAALSADWLPLRFPEEQYTVATLGQFWANVLDSLADTLERQGQSTTELDAEARRIAALPAADQAAACLAAIDHCADARRQRLLLLVDNTDLLLHNIGRDAHWGLRQTLQGNPRILWVGGSYQNLETGTFHNEADYFDAFFDFFHIVELRPLQLDEMEQALLALAETFGGPAARNEMVRQLATRSGRLPTLRQLSGGNPRTTVMLYELFANSREDSVRSDLEALLDDMTPLYKARMDALADLPRKLLAHLLEHWAPVSLGELAALSQVKTTSISPQLQRLELDGLIEKTRLHGTTRSGYQVAERFFNIWYLMRLSPRRQRTRLAWLVEFMRLWFSTDELCDLARRRIDGIEPQHRSASDLEYDLALVDALPDGTPEWHSLRKTILAQLSDNPALAGIFGFDDKDMDFGDSADEVQRVDAAPAVKAGRKAAKPRSRRPARPNPMLDLPAWNWPLATRADENQRFLGRVAFLPIVDVDRDGFLNALAWSLSLNLDEKQKVIDAIPTLSQFQCDELIKVFTEERAKFLELQREHPDDIGKLIEETATEWSVLLWQGSTQAAAGMAELIQTDPLPTRWRHDERTWALLARVLLLDGREEEAHATLRQAAAPPRDTDRLLECLITGTWQSSSKYRPPALAAKHGRRLLGLAEKFAGENHGWRFPVAQSLLEGKTPAREIARDALLPLLANPPADARQSSKLAALVLEKLPELGRHAEAALRRALASNPGSALDWARLGTLLRFHPGRHEEAEAAYREAIARDEGNGRLWNNLGNLLQDTPGRHEEAETAYRRAIALDERNADPWNNLGDLLQDHLGRREEAEAAYRRAIALDAGNAYPITNLARLLAKENRRPEAESCYREATQHAAADDFGLALQAHLFLGNRQLAMTALQALALAAQSGDMFAFHRIREQVRECHEIGLGEPLADGMAEGVSAVFLAPFIQALYTLAGAEAKLQDLPMESQQMVDEIVRQGRERKAAQAMPPKRGR